MDYLATPLDSVAHLSFLSVGSASISSGHRLPACKCASQAGIQRCTISLSEMSA